MGSCASVDNEPPPKPAGGTTTQDKKSGEPAKKRGPRRSINVVKDIVQGWGGTQAQSLREIAPPKLKKKDDKNQPNMKFLKKTKAAARRSIDYARRIMMPNSTLLTVEEEAKSGEIDQDVLEKLDPYDIIRDDVQPSSRRPNRPDTDSFRQSQRSARRFKTPANESEAMNWIHDSLDETPRRNTARGQPSFRGADAPPSARRADPAGQQSFRRTPSGGGAPAAQSFRRAPSGGAGAARPAPKSELEAAELLHQLLHNPPSARNRSPRNAAGAAGRGQYAPPRAATTSSRRNF